MKRARTYVHTREKTTNCPTVSPSVLHRPHLRGQTDVEEYPRLVNPDGMTDNSDGRSFTR